MILYVNDKTYFTTVKNAVLYREFSSENYSEFSEKIKNPPNWEEKKMGNFMTIKRKHIFIIVFILIATYIAIESYPSGFQRKIAEGPSFLARQLSSYLDDNKVNSDPYAASRYRPEDPLYAPLLAIQYGNKEKAETLLAPLVEKGDSEAMFWLAEITYGQSIYSGDTAGELFTKAAKLGNPYAAIKLDSRDVECTRYMGYHCSEEWGEKGRVILEKLAESGDARAGYSLFQHDVMLEGGYGVSLGEDSFSTLAKAAVDGVKDHYYYPLMTLLYFYQLNASYPVWVMSYDSDDGTYLLSEKDKEIIKSLYTLSANNNDIYSINVDFSYKENDQKSIIGEEYIDSQRIRTLQIWSTEFGYAPAIARIATLDRDALFQGAAWAIVNDIKRNDHSFNYGSWLTSFEYIITNKFNQKFLDQNELRKAQEISKELIQTLTPTIYLDENQTDIL
ncbi:hypothetical protein LRP50_24505 [Enterovibrio sp. ZSDZ42]|uniref:Sel1 repeat family protein n=1 Tax=Enterovibrio gelatinilyticus TaxID=2899819 RepID=A0ABT5R976_9GAMM|nr:hypothetical protein [Enterovibrio sp. ZSDZ42]MDD1796286.1 hypothetical protein [Enterovibrio sp. ZSDZ42]